MKRLLFAAFIVLLVTTSCLDRAREQKVIRKILTDYSEAFANNMGSECVKYLDSTTVNYYNYLLSLVRNADSGTVARMRYDQQYAVLGVRHTATPDMIRKMTGRTLFQYLVQLGPAGGGGLNAGGYSTRFLSLNKSQARVQLIDSNNSPGIVFVFNYEDGGWKINLSGLLASFSKESFESILKEKGFTVHDFVVSELEAINGKKPTNAVWHPPAGN